MAATVQLKVNLPKRLVEDLETLLMERHLTIDDVCRLYLRSLVTQNKSLRAVDLDDEMPYGKYKGEALAVIIKTDPQYISWFLSNGKSFKITPEALALLEEITQTAGGEEPS